MFPEASVYPTPMIHAISATATIHVPPTTSRQVDSKKIIAYSPTAHTASVTLGIFTHNPQAIEGSIPSMSSHGTVPSASSTCTGVPHDRHKSRVIRYHSGPIQVMPPSTTSSPVLTSANPSSPTTGGPIGESSILAGLFQSSRTIAFPAGSGMVSGAAYSIRSRNRIARGNPKIHFIKSSADINHREVHMSIPPVLLTPLIGIHPEITSDTIHVPAKNSSP
jgi:NADH:ubiquinone oxidoreductase subunit 4 (subunit M)